MKGSPSFSAVVRRAGWVVALACAATATTLRPDEVVAAAARSGEAAEGRPTPLPGTGASAAGIELSLRDCIERALARNFDLRIERENLVSSESLAVSAAAAYVPTVSISGGVDRTESPGTVTIAGNRTDTSSVATTLSGELSTGATYTASASLAGSTVSPSAGATYDTASGTLGVVEISQPLLKNREINATRLAIRQRNLEVHVAQAALSDQAIATVAAVEQAYFDLVAARETVLVREKALELARQTSRDTLARLQIGTAAPLDEKSAQSDAASREAELIAARQTVREKQNALVALLTDDFATLRGVELKPTDPLAAAQVPVDYAASLGRALTNRRDLDQLDLALEQQRLTTRYQANQRLPQLDLSASYGLKGADSQVNGVTHQWRDRDYPYYGVGLTLSFPWSNRKARSDLHSAQALEKQAELRARQARDTVRAQVDNAVSAVEAAYQRIAATRQAREYAEAALEAERGKLAAGKTTSYNVLQLQRDLTSARADEISARADYNKALSTLRQREATSLAYWQIAFDGPSAASTRASGRSSASLSSP